MGLALTSTPSVLIPALAIRPRMPPARRALRSWSQARQEALCRRRSWLKSLERH